MNAKKHIWEVEKGLIGPYHLCGILETPETIDLFNPSWELRMARDFGVGLGCCEICGMGLSENFILYAAGSKRHFVVGCDCVMKAESEKALVDEVKRAANAKKTEKRHRREDARIAAAVERLPSVEDALASMDHPHESFAKRGETKLDWVLWRLKHAGRAGKLAAARVIESTDPSTRDAGRADALRKLRAGTDLCRRIRMEEYEALRRRKAEAAAADNAWLIDVLNDHGGSGSFVRDMMDKLATAPLAELPPKAVTILRDIYCKAHGRRNSRAYESAWEDFDSHLPEESDA